MKFKLKVILFWLGCFLSVHAYQMDVQAPFLPMAKKTRIQEQFDIFVSAYTTVPWEEIEPSTTRFPGLNAVVEMQYGFAHQVVLDRKNDAHLNCLNDLWRGVYKLLKPEGLTILDLKRIDAQLAYFFDSLNGVEQDIFPGWRRNSADDSQESHSWCDINNFGINMYDSVSCLLETSPFSKKSTTEGGALRGLCCEAILITKRGGFSFERIDDAYLGQGFPIHLSGLSYGLQPEKERDRKGPHGGEYDKSAAAFLKHDFEHLNNFLSLMTNLSSSSDQCKFEGMSRWKRIQSFVGRIHARQDRSPLDEAGLYFLLHEDAEGFLVGALEEKKSLEEAFGQFVQSQRSLYAERTHVKNFIAGSFLWLFSEPMVKYNEPKQCFELSGYLGRYDSDRQTYDPKVVKVEYELHETYDARGALVKREAILKNLSWLVKDHGRFEEDVTDTIRQFSDAMKDITDNAPRSTRRVYDASWLDDERFLVEQGIIAPMPADCAITIKAERVSDGMSQFWQQFYDRNVGLFSAHG